MTDTLEVLLVGCTDAQFEELCKKHELDLPSIEAAHSTYEQPVVELQEAAHCWRVTLPRVARGEL